mgnify:CR=1 FL=1
MWSDQTRAQKLLKERTQLNQMITQTKALSTELEDYATLIDLGESEGDDASVAEGEAGLQSLSKKIKRLEFLENRTLGALNLLDPNKRV